MSLPLPLLHAVSTASAAPSLGGTVSPASGNYPYGTVVNVTATPTSGYTFTNWTGNVASIYSTSTTITMNGPETVNFWSIPSNKNFVVNTASDDTIGVPSNCTTAGGLCTLRDALLAADVAVSGQRFVSYKSGDCSRGS